LIHFIWQGMFVAILLAGVLRILRGQSTNARYAAACAALLLMLAAPLATMAIVMSSAPGRIANELSPVSAAQPESQRLAVEIESAIAPARTAKVTASPPPWSSIWSVRLASSLPWIILVWLLGVVCFSLRLIGGWLYTRRLQHYGNSPLEERWQQALHRLCRQLRVTRPVRLLESALVKVPMVVGWLRPVILLPVGALTGLTARQLEAIIAHELAHIRRHDYLINLLQAVVETLLFCHPAVWWVSRQIRQEREHCCDDLAVAVCGDSLTYARALLEMEQLRAAGPQLAMAANGGLLMNRIQRLVGTRPRHTDRFAGLVAGATALIAVVSVGAGAQILLQSADQKVSSIRQQETRQVKTSAETPGESNRADLEAEHAEAPKQAGIGPGIRRDERLAEPLIAALADRDWQVREASARSLGIIGDRRAVAPLVALLQDGNVYVRDQAITSLAMIGDRRAVEPLISALQDRNVYIRDNAITALGRLRDHRAVEPLIALLKDGNVYIRDNAAAALGALGDPRAIEPLKATLDDENPYVRETAAKSLAQLSGN